MPLAHPVTPSVLTWVRSTCRGWPGIRWRRRRRSWRWCTRHHGKTAQGGSNEARRYKAWREEWRWPAGPPGREARCCLYPAGEGNKDMSTVNDSSDQRHCLFFMMLAMISMMLFFPQHVIWFADLCNLVGWTFNWSGVLKHLRGNRPDQCALMMLNKLTWCCSSWLQLSAPSSWIPLQVRPSASCTQVSALLTWSN